MSDADLSDIARNLGADLADIRSMLAATLATQTELMARTQVLTDRVVPPAGVATDIPIEPGRALDSTLRGVVVVSPDPVVVTGQQWREPPRRPEDRQADYLEQFDVGTVFYDAFHSGPDIVLNGPPALNALPLLRAARFQVDGLDVTNLVRLDDRGRTQESRITGVPVGQKLRVTIDEIGLDATIALGSDYAPLFAGRRALVTLSKNNELAWIKDWLTFYHRIHGVDAVLLYDNNSTKYTIGELQSAIASVPGIEVGAVVGWPFPYGPGGGPRNVWDSDFCQYSMLEHARWRFLQRAAGVINADVDELVVSSDDRTAFDHAAESPVGAVVYGGRWIEKVTEEPLDPDRTRRFTDYGFHRNSGCTTKWTLVPGRLPDDVQWRVHSINGLDVPRRQGLMHRHFQGINTNWKYDRKESLAKPGTHQRDERLLEVLSRAFGKNTPA